MPQIHYKRIIPGERLSGGGGGLRPLYPEMSGISVYEPSFVYFIKIPRKKYFRKYLRKMIFIFYGISKNIFSRSFFLREIYLKTP
jgi:hypothetical protein